MSNEINLIWERESENMLIAKCPFGVAAIYHEGEGSEVAATLLTRRGEDLTQERLFPSIEAAKAGVPEMIRQHLAK